MIGKTLSHYKIIEKLGQGGMGEVYLAEDSRLDRKVALKILPQHLSERAELRERFEREARAVSSLNHPHICTLYDIGEQDGIHYLVMEHLVGETLEARLAKGALPLEQTLEYAIQIADALDKAHRQGVVHRDLKPGNIMLVKSGAKLLDFGLAKLQAAETPTNLSALPTEQANLTAEGTILGTLQYMAPEQLEGKEADSRTDLFAFGAVVYEMATGKKAFEGKSQASLIAAIMGQDPRPMAELQPMTPQVLDWVVKRCLAKEPDERWQTANDLMAGLKQTTEVGTSVDSFPAVSAPAAWKRAIPWSIAVVGVVFGVSIAFWSSSSPTSPSLRKLVITPSPTAPLGNRRFADLAISPDGRHVVYSADVGTRSQLYVRAMDGLTAAPLPGTEGVDRDFFFSHDSEWVAFVVGSNLKKVSLVGGAPITLCDVEVFEGGYWGSENTIVFTAGLPNAGLYRVSANGGQPESLAMPDLERGEDEYQQPEILPGGRAVLFAVMQAGFTYQIAVLSLETGEQKTLIENGRQPHYLPTGHLVYELTATGTLMAVPFDVERLELSGNPVPVFEGVRSGFGEGTADYSISDDGTLIYASGGVTGGQENVLVWVDRKGAAQLVTEMQRDYWGPQVSPDGRRLALTIDQIGNSDVWIYDINSGILTPFTFAEGASARASWSPDGKRLAFTSNREGVYDIYWKPSDGSGEVEKLIASEYGTLLSSWSPQGVLAYSENVGGSNFRDIWVLALEGERKPEEFLATRFNERNPVFSPDGRWIALTSNQSGQDEIYVKSYADQGGTIQISIDGGQEPLWAPDGKELFYRNGDQMMVVSVVAAPTFQAQTPRLLFEGSYRYDPGSRFSNYDISPDGQRFVMVKETEDQETSQINVVLNWFEELKRLVPTDN